MLIRDLLSGKNGTVVTVPVGTSTLKAIEILNKNQIGSLIVTNARAEVAGILSERDILANFQESAKGIPVDSIMTRREDLIIAGNDDSIDYAMAVMTEKRIRHLPVFDGESLVGIVSIGDVVKAVKANLEIEARMLSEYIAGSAALIP